MYYNLSMEKLVELITKDTTASNESNKLTVVIRMLSLYYAVTLLIAMFFSIGFGEDMATLLQLLMMIAILAVFGTSYVASRATTMWAFIVFVFAWGIMSIRMYGWTNGIQAFFVIPMIVYCFANYGKNVFKIGFAFFTFVIYILSFFIFRDDPPLIESTSIFYDMSRLGVMFSIIFVVGLLSYVFSRESQKLEKKLIEYNKKLEEKAFTDPLTSLYNRSKAREILAELVGKSTTEPFSMCMCDIDFFKRVNDSYGHDVGDLVLKNISSIFTKELEGKGYCARWGGEEFLLLFPGMNGDDANAVVFDIQHAIRHTSVKIAGKDVKVTMTFGINEFNRNMSIDENIKEADNKLYMGKQSGRDVVIY